jgi:hypothetical protein
MAGGQKEAIGLDRVRLGEGTGGLWGREETQTDRILPALAGSDKNGARFELERVVPLLCGEGQVEG